MVKDVEYLMICFPSSLSMKNLEKDYEAVQLNYWDTDGWYDLAAVEDGYY